jgi:hypothetical protein
MDNSFRQLLAEVLGASIVTIDADGYFEVVSCKELPLDLSQLSTKFTVTTPSEPVMVLGDYTPYSHAYGGSQYSYWFHPMAEGAFSQLLSRELEKKRYREFSETFDKEVQSELEQ